MIRLTIPPLTQQRRDELIKLVARRVEEARVAVRNVRRDVLHHVDALDLPEDEIHRVKERIQVLTDRHIKLAEEHGDRKTAEIREV